MNRLDNKERANILRIICEGMGINATCRVTGASKNTVLKLLADVGKEGEANFDLIFGKKKTNGGWVPPPLSLNEYPDNGEISDEPPRNEW